MLKSLNYGTKPAFPAAEEETKEASIFQGTLGLLSSLHEGKGKTEARCILQGGIQPSGIESVLLTWRDAPVVDESSVPMPQHFLYPGL